MNKNRVVEWCKKNNIPEEIIGCISQVPGSDEEGEVCSEFYIKLENIGNKHWVNKNEEELLIKWLKLTNKLLLLP